MTLLVITEAARKLETLQELRDFHAVRASSHDKRKAAALRDAIAVLEHHQDRVEQERAALPLLCALVDAVRATQVVRNLGEAVEARESLERAMEKAGPYVDDCR